jgi:threonine aldolase
MKIYDLRSDTITKPSEGMRKVMYEAEVGDDVFGEDPTVNKLQDMSAEITGKEAALFVSSGTMGNLIPVFLLCGRGNEFLAHEKAHILHYELSGCAAIAGAMPVAVKGERGILKRAELKKHLRGNAYYMSQVKMLALENTHNLAGGTCYSLNEIRDVCDFANENNLKVHIDGARIFNAQEATGVSVKKMSESADSITFCLSKGLGAPAGAVLCGSRNFIEEARRVRKLLGGGMRQAGIIAAAGIYALLNNISRIKKDNEYAELIAEVLRERDWVDSVTAETNIIFCDVVSGKAGFIAERLADLGILSIPMTGNSLRFVLHLEISKKNTQEICEIIKNTPIL